MCSLSRPSMISACALTGAGDGAPPLIRPCTTSWATVSPSRFAAVHSELKLMRIELAVVLSKGEPVNTTSGVASLQHVEANTYSD